MKKRLSIKVLSLVLTLALFVGMLAATGISVIAYSEDTYESAGFNFLRSQYDMRGMTSVSYTHLIPWIQSRDPRSRVGRDNKDR